MSATIQKSLQPRFRRIVKRLRSSGLDFNSSCGGEAYPRSQTERQKATWPATVRATAPYFLPLIFVTVFALGLLYEVPGTFRTVAVFWLVAIILDVVWSRADTISHRTNQAKRDCSDWAFNFVLWLFVPAYPFLLAASIWFISRGSLKFEDLILLAATVGFTGGAFAIPVAHELMHRSGRLEKASAFLLMMLFNYPHFSIEHLRGHHINVATPHDPATARVGESFYSFFSRSVRDSLIDAWRIEVTRLGHANSSVVSIGNRLLRNLAVLILAYVLIGYALGWQCLLFFMVQGIVGFTLLEAVNFIQHYGLQRRKVSLGRYEEVSPMHSWESNHPVSNWLLFNLTRHAAHHCDPSKHFGELLCTDQAPRLPVGILGMFCLALIPPLWRYTMDRRVHAIA